MAILDASLTVSETPSRGVLRRGPLAAPWMRALIKVKAHDEGGIADD
jgi:hypothetical protein